MFVEAVSRLLELSDMFDDIAGIYLPGLTSWLDKPAL